MTDPLKGIRSIWDENPDDPAEAIWMMCRHLDHLGKTHGGHLGTDLVQVAEYIEHHLGILSPPGEPDDVL